MKMCERNNGHESCSVPWACDILSSFSVFTVGKLKLAFLIPTSSWNFRTCATRLNPFLYLGTLEHYCSFIFFVPKCGTQVS